MKTASVLKIVFVLFGLQPLTACGDFPRPFAGNPGASALRLSHPPPARLTIPPPTEAMLPAADAARLAHDLTDALVAGEVPAFAEPARPGDWQLRLTATLGQGSVVPHYILVDAAGHARGDIPGDPAPAAAWAAGDAATLHAAAATAVPQILALLRSVDADIKHSDPGSLYNRPARIFLAGVTGAPGDGNRTLEHEMRIKLPDTGDLIVKSLAAADFTVHGVVRVTDLPSRQQQIEIHWLVHDPAGKEAGDVAQGHDVEGGSLDHTWGEVASAVAEEAAGGVHEVISNWTGRRAKGEAPAHPSAPLSSAPS